MLGVALEAEVGAYIEGLDEEVDEDGYRLVVRSGHAPPRTITTGAGHPPILAAFRSRPHAFAKPQVITPDEYSAPTGPSQPVGRVDPQPDRGLRILGT